MPFTNPPDSIVLPGTAGPNDTQILIGQDIPPEIEFDALGNTILAVIIWRYNEEEYYFESLSSDGSITYRFTGIVNLGANLNTVTWLNNLSISGGGLDTARAYIEHGDFENGNFDADGIQWPVVHNFQYSHLYQGKRAAYPSNGNPRHICAESEGINGDSAADSTNSATYINMAGTTSFNFYKFYDDSRIKVTIEVGGFASAINLQARYGVRINGTDYDVCKCFYNLASTHLFASGTRYIPDIPSGLYVIQGRWLSIGGAGTVQRNANDSLSIHAEEVTGAA